MPRRVGVGPSSRQARRARDGSVGPVGGGLDGGEHLSGDEARRSRTGGRGPGVPSIAAESSFVPAEAATSVPAATVRRASAFTVSGQGFRLVVAKPRPFDAVHVTEEAANVLSGWDVESTAWFDLQPFRSWRCEGPIDGEWRLTAR